MFIWNIYSAYIRKDKTNHKYSHFRNCMEREGEESAAINNSHLFKLLEMTQTNKQNTKDGFSPYILYTQTPRLKPELQVA